MSQISTTRESRSNVSWKPSTSKTDARHGAKTLCQNPSVSVQTRQRILRTLVRYCSGFHYVSGSSFGSVVHYLTDTIVDRIESTRNREGRPSICLCGDGNTHQRAAMWDILYVDIGLPDSLKKLYRVSRNMLQFSLMTLEEMNDSPDPPLAPFPTHTDPTTSQARMLTVSGNTTEVRKSK